MRATNILDALPHISAAALIAVIIGAIILHIVNPPETMNLTAILLDHENATYLVGENITATATATNIAIDKDKLIYATATLRIYKGNEEIHMQKIAEIRTKTNETKPNLTIAVTFKILEPGTYRTTITAYDWTRNQAATRETQIQIQNQNPS